MCAKIMFDFLNNPKLIFKLLYYDAMYFGQLYSMILPPLRSWVANQQQKKKKKKKVCCSLV